MTIIAQISDLHLLERGHEKRSGLDRTRLALLSAGAPLDAEARIRAARHTLHLAERAGADHVVITGDLTEDGAQAQFEVLAELLDQTGLPGERITLVPGNHDGYSDGRSGFFKALAGPLSAYQQTSRAGATTVLEDAVIQPISTVVDQQWFTQAAGVLHDADAVAIRRTANDAITRHRAHVVAQHHPPALPGLSSLRWFDHVTNGVALRELLRERSRVHVLHGHVHRDTTQSLCGREHAQVFSTSSVRDGGHVLRLYKAEDGMLREISAPLPSPQFAASTRGFARGLSPAMG
jgi:3',5'-cyclic AMP phosphodiesterase CpdA